MSSVVDDVEDYEFLVKYTKSDYLEVILNNQLKAGFPHEFNDPFDSRFYVSAESIQEIAAESKHSVDEVKYYIEHLQSVQITCLIRANPLSFDSNLMWAHYANSGNEIAVLYDFKEVKTKYSGTLESVNYAPKLIDTKKILSTYMQIYVNQEQNTVEGRREMLDFYYNKSKIWTYESEYRILTFGYLSSIMGIFAKYNNVKLTWDDKCEILKTKYLSFNTYFDLSSRYKKFMSHQDSKNLNPSGYVGVNGISQSVTLDIPHYDTLLIDMPKASKIILGWNFSKHKKDYIIKKCKEKNIILSEISIPLDVTSSEYEETILFDGVANE